VQDGALGEAVTPELQTPPFIIASSVIQ
jgi:hypothetical protein